MLHEIQHGGKADLIIEKRTPFSFGRIMSLPNVENRAKIRQQTTGILCCKSSSFQLPGAA